LGCLPTTGFINEIIKPASSVAHSFFNATSDEFGGYYIHGQGLYCDGEYPLWAKGSPLATIRDSPDTDSTYREDTQTDNRKALYTTCL
jgi:hypothetical protein